MKIAFPWQAYRQIRFGLRLAVVAMTAAFLLAAANLFAATTATTVELVGGQGHPGYADGDTYHQALFNTPCGLALDPSGTQLLVADRDNNKIRLLELSEGVTYDLAISPSATNLINHPIAVAIDSSSDVFVLNRGDGNNGTVLEFDGEFGDLIATNAAHLTNATAMALDAGGNIFVTIKSNTLIRITSPGVSNVVATITQPGAFLQGIVLKHNGLIAACDSGRNGIYLINPTSGIVTTNAGFHGAGDFLNPNNSNPDAAPSQFVEFNQPMGIAEAGDGSLIVTDYGNNRVKVIKASNGAVTNLYGVASADWNWAGNPYPGFSSYAHPYDGLAEAVQIPDTMGGVSARLPNGIVLSPNGDIYVTEDYYHIIRHVAGAGFQPLPPLPPAAPTILTVTTNFGQVTLTWSTVPNATGYNVERAPSSSGPYAIIATNITATTFTDTTVVNGTTYYYVVTALNAGGESLPSNEVSATPPLPPVPNPQIGWVTFPPPSFTSVFNVGSQSGVTFNNDVPIVIIGAAGSQTFYNYADTTNFTSITNPAAPPHHLAPSGYADGLSLSSVTNLTVAEILPNLAIKAIGEQAGHPNSAVVPVLFQFVVAEPFIPVTATNIYSFTITEITTNASLYYTVDGSVPSSTNGFDLSTIATFTNNVWSVHYNQFIQTDTVFRVRAFRNNYQPSEIASNNFTLSSSVANTISFGFAPNDPVAQGEASSVFVGSPGQTFYAPVTMSVLSDTKMYSLQFNVTVADTYTISPAQVASGTIGFQSMLVQPIPPPTNFPPGVSLYAPIPPYMFIANETGPVPPNSLTNYNGTNFVILEFVTTNNLLGVGWLERYTQTNLYNTLSQDLIQFSMAHDDVFQQANGDVIVGGYAFQVPTNAGPNDAYQIQIGRPSATSDGVGAPGSSVFIATPTNGSLGGGAINSIKIVTLGQRKYIAGDSAPFRWFNAGDFGNTNLENSDVEQVFQSAIYQFNYPPAGSDFFDAMDSSGNFGAYDGDTGYYTNAAPMSVSDKNAIFNGNDTTINQIAFGDTSLDVCDVYVTFRRSLNTNLVWFQRFWTNGTRVAVITNAFITPSVAFALHGGGKFQPAFNPNLDPVSITNTPSVNFAGGDFQATAGQTIQIPVTATVFGSYPLRVAMLNISVVPLDGSPALTTPISFSPGALGAPSSPFTASSGNGNYAAAWMNSAIAGISNTATIGTLNVTIPANAMSSSAYAVHFDHASGSPNGIASFPKHTLTGLITLSSRNTSSFNDNIPDSWRLRWFGTINNLLSVSNACPSGDGINNWKKYVAGVDPNTPNDFPSLNPNTPPPSGAAMSIYWPTVSGKQYAILSSASLFPGTWATNAIVTGNGANMEYDDHSTGTAKFYRVLILP
jgi:hypothetical protein